MCQAVHAGHHPVTFDEPRQALPRLRAVLRRMLFWHERSRQRAVLAELDQHLLDDIGVTRAQARSESLKPFWRD